MMSHDTPEACQRLRMPGTTKLDSSFKQTRIFGHRRILVSESPF